VGSVPGADETVLYHTLERSALRRARVAYPLLRDERNDVNDAETDRLRRRHARD
jgi:predicted amidohydrolase